MTLIRSTEDVTGLNSKSTPYKIHLNTDDAMLSLTNPLKYVPKLPGYKIINPLKSENI